MSVVLTALLLATASTTAEVPSAIFVHRSGSGGASVWRVHADGRTEPIPGEFPEAAGGIAYLGTSYPVPSPDGRFLAFLGGGQIRIRDLGSGEEQAVTALDDPSSKYRLKVTHWSADSRELLYHVGAPVPPPTDDDCGMLVRDDPVEYRVYAVETGKDRQVALPPDTAIAAWLPDGSFLVVPALGREGAWGSWSEGDDRIRPLTEHPGRFAQFAPSAAAGKVMALMDSEGMSRIASIDLADGGVEIYTPRFRFSVVQMGSFSPAGTHAAWILRPSLRSDARALVSGDRTLLRCPGPIAKYVWVGDGALAAQCEGDLVVLDFEDGHVLSRTPLPARR